MPRLVRCLEVVATILLLFLGSTRVVICEQFFLDVIANNSCEKIEGRIKAESDQSVTLVRHIHSFGVGRDISKGSWKL